MKKLVIFTTIAVCLSTKLTCLGVTFYSETKWPTFSGHFYSSGNMSDNYYASCLWLMNEGIVVAMRGGKISGNEYSTVKIPSFSYLKVYDGEIDVASALCQQSSYFIIYGGLLNFTTGIGTGGICSISGGDVTTKILAGGSESLISITGGKVTIDELRVLGGNVCLFGGLLDIKEYTYTSGNIDVYVRDFEYNSITEVITGHLYTGDCFSIGGVDTNEYGTFTFIPEPITLVMLGFGGFFLKRNRKLNN